MREFKKIISAITFYVCALSGVDAHAALISYNVGGTFVDGSTFQGSFTVDPDGDVIDQFSNVHVVLNGIEELNRIAAAIYYPPASGVGGFGIGFSGYNYGDSTIAIFFQAYHSGSVLKEVIGTRLDPSSKLTLNGRGYALRTGSISVAAIPESTTWSLIILGFGMVGFSLRYRQLQRKILYAAR